MITRCPMLLLAMLLAPASMAATLYVSPDGDDASAEADNINAPWRTIHAAAQVARPGDQVSIRAGEYRETVVPARSGTAEAPIVFQPHADEHVVIKGVDDVRSMTDARWQVWKSQVNGDDAIYVIDVDWTFDTSINQARQLFFNQQMMIDARFPNIPEAANLDPMHPEWLAFDTAEVPEKVSDAWPNGGIWSYTFTDAELRRVRDLDGEPIDLKGSAIWYQPRHVGARRWGFTSRGTIVQHDGQSVTFHANGEGVRNKKKPEERTLFQAGNPYWLGGKLAFLDAPGEWYYDAEAKKLYFYAPGGADPNEHEVELKTRDWAFQLSTKTGSGRLAVDFRSHIHLKDLVIFGASVITDLGAVDGRGSGNSDKGRDNLDHGAPLADSTNVVLDGVHLKYINHMDDFTGLQIFQWVQTSGVILSGTEHVMRNCIVQFACGNGIMALGDRHLIENNLIHDAGYSGTHTAAINLGHGWINHDITIRRNTVWRTGNNGIATQWNLNTENPAHPAAVAYNRIQSYGMLTEDVGALKFVGHERPGIDLNGPQWHHNVISHGNADEIALYHDFTDDYVIHHNLVYDVYRAININDGRDHRIYHNTLSNYGTDAVISDAHNSVTRTDIRNNIMIGGGIDDGITTAKGNTIRPNLENASRDIFVAPERGNYQLQGGARQAIDQGEVIAGITGEVQGQAPDLGAFEFGGEDWTQDVGATVGPLWNAPSHLQARRSPRGAVLLRWQDNADNETDYYVERGTEIEHGHRLWEVAARLPADTTSWVDEEAEARRSENLYYRVRANHSLYAETTSVEPVR